MTINMLNPDTGAHILQWADLLARHSEPPWDARGELTAIYLTHAHLATAGDLAQWMRDSGFDSVTTDAVGNVVGVYRAARPDAPVLMTGSHYDTVRNAGKYDGRLGILVPIACVAALARAGRRLSFDIELVAFAEEEGQRFRATFLGSGALTGDFDPQWLDQQDAHGLTMRDAMRAAGLPGEMAAIGALRRDPSRYLGFVEVHIEQGPVLVEQAVPLGVVTSINAGARYVCEAGGRAEHAGTTPMGMRRDALLAAAEISLLVEQRASLEPGLVGTVGQMEVPGGSINVIPGSCRFTLDLRAPTNAQRDALVADVLEGARKIAARRQISLECNESMRVAAAPSDPAWQARWERAVAAIGQPVFRLNSGAGHDAMKLHTIMPQAMLFVRGGNRGISHNPLEIISAEDAALAVHAFTALLDDLDVNR